MDPELKNSHLGESPLMLWIRTFQCASVADLTDLMDGHLLNKIMTEIDPTFFGMSFVHSNVHEDINLRIHNLEHLLRNMKGYYQAKLQQVVVMELPNIFAMTSNPESEESLQELSKILFLILGCAVQCERKELFVEKITSMDESIQQELVLHIKEITEKFDKILAFQPNEIAALPHEELLSFCELMYDQIIRLVDQRDFNAQEINHLLVDRVYPSKEVNGNISRVGSPPLSPTNSERVLAERTKLRQVSDELEERNILIQDLRDELECNKLANEKLVQKNKSLTETSRWVNAYRDQLDVLRIKAERTDKLENDVVKYKEKLLEMEVMKKRIEELEEQNDILFNTKTVLEKQVDGLTPKAERLAEAEREMVKLRNNIKVLTEERAALEMKHKNVLDENAMLLLDAQNSLSEVSSLSSELSMIKDKEETGTCLANECSQISSTQFLRLENENHRLKVLIGELTQYKAAAVPQSVVAETEVENGTYEMASLSDEEITEEHEVNIVKSLTSVKKVLNRKEIELAAVQDKLTKKEAWANTVSESLFVKEQENNELRERIQQLMNNKRRTDELMHCKDEDVAELERRLEEVMASRRRTEENLRKKSSEVTELTNSLVELKEDKERSVEAALRKTKDVSDLKKRVETLLLEKEEVVDNCAVKTKRLADLDNRLQRLQDANKDLAETLESKREKISTQEKRVNELIFSAKEEERRHSEMVREKDRRVKEFERKIADLIEVENELERLNSQIKQKDRKSDGFLKTIEQKDQEIVELENRLEDAKSNNNKLLYNLELKEKKLGSLEQRLIKVESQAEKQETIEDKAQRQIQESRDDKILELESRLEDALNSAKKLEHTLKVKDEKIVFLETRMEEAQAVELERDKLVKSLEHKRKRITELESSLDDVSEENQKLTTDLRVKGNKLKDLEERVRAMETESEGCERLRGLVKEKEEKISSLSDNINSLLEQLVVFENRVEEASSQNKKLIHAVKIKEDRIAGLEERVLELEELTNQNRKLRQIVEQKEDKLRAMEEKLDECEESALKCSRLTEKVAIREERIRTLNERLSELEAYERNNQKLNQAITQKDEKIKSLELSLEDVQLKFKNLENEMAKVHKKYEDKVKRSLEDVDTHKIRRQESVRRREEQIKSLEKSRSKLETVLHAQEGHIQTLQERLEGSVTERNKLGSSITKKESVITQLQSKVLELEEATTENKKLDELVRIRDETIQRYEDRVREVELVLSRAKASNREKDDEIEALQKRIDDCAEHNRKLDLRLKKKEENVLKTERELLKLENREKELKNYLEKKSQNLEECNKRILELETSLEETGLEVMAFKRKEEVSFGQPGNSFGPSPRTSTPSTEDSSKFQTIKQKLWEAEARLEETENEKGKLQHLVKRREAQIQDLEKRLEECTDALEENERLKNNIRHKEERVRILQASLEQNQEEINSLESRLESSTSEIYKLRKSDDDNRKRINSFKMKLENSDGVHETLVEKEERIHTLEERNNQLQDKASYLKECLESLQTELEQTRRTTDSTETVTMNQRLDNARDVIAGQADHKILHENIEMLNEKHSKLRLENNIVVDRCSTLNAEKESLTQELESLRSDYDQLLNDLNELKESYTELDLSSTKSLHRCEMLNQMNSTLEEENRMLMEQMNKLLTQNQELLTESLVSRDQFMEEERSFSDRLYELQRQKEKLEEKIEQANRSLAENTPKKKSNLFKKVLQKAGLKKKKDEPPKSRSAVQLVKYDRSPNGTEGSSDVSAESGASFQGVYPLSPERVSDSSNFSEGDSPERDLSPLARRRGRVNRARRARVVRSEYFTPAMANSLALQGRSRSLDAKEFLRDVIQAHQSEQVKTPAVLAPSSSLTVLRDHTTSESVDNTRQDSGRSREVYRTRSFSVGRRDSESGNEVRSLGHVMTKSMESKSDVGKPFPDIKTPKLTASRDTSVTKSRETGQEAGGDAQKASESSRRGSEVGSSHSRSSSLCSGDASSDTSRTTVRHVGSTSSKAVSGHVTALSSDSKVAKKQSADGGKIGDTREYGTAAELRLFSASGDSTGSEKLKRLSRHQTPSPPPRISVTSGSESSPLRPTENSERSLVRDRPPSKRSSSFSERPHSPSLARSQVQRQHSDRVFVSSMEVESRNTHQPKVGPSGVATERPRRPLSTGHRPNSFNSNDETATGQSIGIVSYKEVPRVQSAVLESSPLLERKRHDHSDSSGSRGSHKETHRMQSGVLESSPQLERKQKVHSDSSGSRGSHKETPRVQSGVLESSPQLVRKRKDHSDSSGSRGSHKETPRVQSGVLESSPPSVRKRKDHSDSSESRGSYKETQRVQSAVLESSPRLEWRPKEQSSSPGSRGPQTPKTLRRTSKIENLSFETSSYSTPKNERSVDKAALWFEYGEV